jgi:hypothetical protein
LSNEAFSAEAKPPAEAAPDASTTLAAELLPAACAAIDCICCSADESAFTGNVMFSPGNDDRHARNRTDLSESIAVDHPGKPRN